jgi:hypothetical protein
LGSRFFELEELLRPVMVVRERSRRGLRPAEFAANQALLDATRRAGASWPWQRRRGADGDGGGVGGDGSGRSL